MNVPEVRLEVSTYLQPPALAVCSRVSKEWNKSFIPVLYRDLAFVHDRPAGFPRDGMISQLACSLRQHQNHIRSLRLSLMDIHMDQLLREIMIYGEQLEEEASVDSAGAKTRIKATSFVKAKMAMMTRGKTWPPMFNYLEHLALVIYDPWGADLAWLAHCPQLYSLHLTFTPQSWFRKMTFRVPPPPWFQMWLTTLTHLRISCEEPDQFLPVQILRQGFELTELALSCRPLGPGTFQTLLMYAHSLRGLNLMGSSNLQPWMLQRILRLFTELEKLSVSTFSVFDVMRLVHWSGERIQKEWTCTRLKCLKINFLEWSAKSEANTKFLEQLVRLKELDSLYILKMRIQERKDFSNVVVHCFPIETPWNEAPCKKPLEWMTKLWPKLTKYESSGWR
ncbi:hypothetical protein EMPS_06526 [Entomortierella parvispora]|uniref:F-box domain-containing protein n=1 Tax=Entomortierella parvispora TaxID=205924 RepID=A0A9P3LXJ5_9FUNG|nr:hypothetical protein EMPS_06526 [Entomortierella parvispora]